MCIRLALRSMTLNDLELLCVQIFLEFCATLHFWEATTGKQIKIDVHCCAMKVLFNNV